MRLLPESGPCASCSPLLHGLCQPWQSSVTERPARDRLEIAAKLNARPRIGEPPGFGLLGSSDPGGSGRKPDRLPADPPWDTREDSQNAAAALSFRPVGETRWLRSSPPLQAPAPVGACFWCFEASHANACAHARSRARGSVDANPAGSAGELDRPEIGQAQAPAGKQPGRGPPE